jgi:hypothetical protein
MVDEEKIRQKEEEKGKAVIKKKGMVNLLN